MCKTLEVREHGIIGETKASLVDPEEKMPARK